MNAFSGGRRLLFHSKHYFIDTHNRQAGDFPRKNLEYEIWEAINPVNRFWPYISWVVGLKIVMDVNCLVLISKAVMDEKEEAYA